jgi:hypothetical protein
MIISLQMLINDWINDTYNNHGDFCEHYPIQCSEGRISMCGYKIATINDDYIVFHECMWISTKMHPSRSDSKDVILQAADPKFFAKLKRRIDRRLKFGVG